MRIRAVLKRCKATPDATPAIYDDGTLRIDLERRHVFKREEHIHLTPTEFRLLSCLVRAKGQVLSHEKLLSEVWGAEYVGNTTCLSLYIRYLRQKLEDDPQKPKYIQTQWGTGYWFALATGG